MTTSRPASAQRADIEPPLAVRVREAEAADTGPASAVLAAAFENYPWTELTVDVDRRTERLRALYGVVLGRLVVPHGRVWVAEDADGQVVGAAGWLTSDADPSPELLAEVGAEVRRLRGVRAEAAESAEAAVAAVSGDWPTDNVWTLGTLGVLPGLRGARVGTALLEEGLGAVDADGAEARLETSSARNVRLYERHGFTVASRIDVADGVPCWLMRRPPR